jgi:hypothetical protein
LKAVFEMVFETASLKSFENLLTGILRINSCEILKEVS